MRSTTACTPSEHVSPSFRCHLAQLHRAGHVGPKGASAWNAPFKAREIVVYQTQFPPSTPSTCAPHPATGVWLSYTLMYLMQPLLGCQECSTVGRARVCNTERKKFLAILAPAGVAYQILKRKTLVGQPLHPGKQETSKSLSQLDSPASQVIPKE